jgi:MFS family permease
MFPFLVARWPAFRHRNFRLFFAGQLASLVGTWMQSAAQLWLVYRLTGSAALLGALGFASQIPIFVLAPVGGLVSDTCDRRRSMLATQGASMLLAFLLAALTLTSRVQVWHLLAIALSLGIVNAFDIPIRQAFLTDMVGKPDLMNAVALNSSMFHAARMVGPAMAGVVIAAVGEGWCFFVNGVSFLAVLASLVAMTRGERPAAAAGRAGRRLADGLRFVFTTPPVRSVLLLLGMMSLVGAPYSVLLPIIANRVLHLDSRGLGGLMGAAGGGALAGALLLATRPRPERLRHIIPRATAVAAVGLLLLSQSHWTLLSGAALIAVGFGITTQLAATNTLLQIHVPDEMRGRVMAVYAMMFMGTAPIGALLAGAVAQRMGALPTVGIGGACCLVGAAVFTLRSSIRRSESASRTAAAG